MPVTPDTGPEVLPSGGFVRPANVFATRITGDGSSGYLAEPGRYQLYASLADPWAHRALIVRRLARAGTGHRAQPGGPDPRRARLALPGHHRWR